MTIISGEDKRNSAWASDKSAFGQRMLLKMGWSEGKGLGKHKQGTKNNLRAIRREDGLGIGAKTDTFGDDGFSQTSKNFHGVLASLHAEHGNKKQKRSKKEKKSKRKKSSESNNNSDSNSNSNDNNLTLSQNKVTAGHARKMRESKDLTKKSKEDMAAIFGMKVEEYQSTSVWGRLSSLSTATAVSSSSEKGKSNNSNGDDKQDDDKQDEGNARNLQTSESELKLDSNNGSSSSSKKRRKDKKKRKRNKEETENDEIDDANDNVDSEEGTRTKIKSKKSKKRRKEKD